MTRFTKRLQIFAKITISKSKIYSFCLENSAIYGKFSQILKKITSKQSRYNPFQSKTHKFQNFNILYNYLRKIYKRWRYFLRKLSFSSKTPIKPKKHLQQPTQKFNVKDINGNYVFISDLVKENEQIKKSFLYRK